MLKDERIGKFEIRSEYFEGPAKKDWLFMLSSYMIVLRPEGMFCKDAIEYVKISPLFESCPEGEIIQEMTGLSYGTIASYALKRFGLKRCWIKTPLKKEGPKVEPEDPNTPENIQMLKTRRCKGINGLPCTGKIRIDKTGVEGLACWLAICHYGHTFSFFIPEKIKN